MKESNSFQIIGLDGRENRNLNIIEKYNFNLAEFVVGGKISNEEKGCLISHQMVYQEMIEKDIKHAFIFEDDAKLNVDVIALFKLEEQFIYQNWEMVNLHAKHGGVLWQKSGSTIAKEVIPSLTSHGYWIANEGARKLYARNKRILGLADWPASVFKVHSGALIDSIVSTTGQMNSLISNNLPETAKYRKVFYLRPIYNFLLTKDQRKNLRQLTEEIGFFKVVRLIFFCRLLKRSARIISQNKKGENLTSILNPC
jgi:GR25 family glycosyltransferase involved in LPS biosynthesis